MIKMTRNEALYIVKGYLTDIIPVENYLEVEEIIKALEQETCEDCISRRSTIKVISTPCGMCLARDSKDCEKCSVPKLSKLINAMPSVESKVET